MTSANSTSLENFQKETCSKGCCVNVGELKTSKWPYSGLEIQYKKYFNKKESRILKFDMYVQLFHVFTATFRRGQFHSESLLMILNRGYTLVIGFHILFVFHTGIVSERQCMQFHDLHPLSFFMLIIHSTNSAVVF